MRRVTIPSNIFMSPQRQTSMQTLKSFPEILCGAEGAHETFHSLPKSASENTWKLFECHVKEEKESGVDNSLRQDSERLLIPRRGWAIIEERPRRGRAARPPPSRGVEPNTGQPLKKIWCSLQRTWDWGGGSSSSRTMTLNIQPELQSNGKQSIWIWVCNNTKWEKVEGGVNTDARQCISALNSY